jgi:predicted phosphoribosyltransferase
MTRFANRADGGRQLIDPVREALGAMMDPVLIAIMPGGVPVAEPLADALGLPLVVAAIDREGEPRVTDLPDVAGRDAVVIDDGVETGTAARLVGSALRSSGAARLVLAVPVCPRQAEAHLQSIYDAIIALDRPLGRRDLRWHYDDFDSIDEAEALRRLDAR